MIDTTTVPWFLWPFAVLWNLVCGILKLTGRLITAVLGVVLLVVGVLLSLTIIGAIAGIPLAILGVMLMIRAVF